ncbi:bilirubin oxidase [Streptomyces venezuelae]|uniref:Multicopper oxidase CueO n=1 Tax=Streptomyces venezuelae TaxID=54571 RepID=A0A5P2CE63_STRVZ|nr:multicopper oxidase domain-containing protein [Streptomyces venezuelae]QES39651.1 bilirubin oxidase [Streptomyces venezuelae]
MVTRRRLLGTGLAAAGVGLTGASFTPLLGVDRAKASPAPAAAAIPELFTVPMPQMPVLRPTVRTATTDYYDVTTRRVRKEILPGIQTDLITYDGNFPGATLKARSGRTVVVRQHNELDVATSSHLHGASVTQANDGDPMDTLAPGGVRAYTYPNKQPHASLWYHDHAHHMESENVYRGLHGSYLLTDAIEDKLPLPKGEYDVVIAIRDAHFDAAGQLVYVMDDQQRSTLLVNGAPYPFFQVAARKYRLRFANMSNQRFLGLRLADGSEIVQIGSDGGLLPRPHTTDSLTLSPGERIDVVVDFSRYKVGDKVVLENTIIFAGSAEQVGQVMRFDVVRTAADSSAVPAVLRSLPALPTPTNERTVVLKMEEGVAHPKGFVDGKTYDPARVDASIRFGASEVWTVTNANARVPHNFHMHLVQFRVLERGGKPPAPGESGLKDTVIVAAGETVKLQATFDSYRGSYVYHCHMLDHSAMGMMATMKIS